ncbi:hypothetical protein KY290_008126 [Solanum tuberosum]|uniref:MULE transposase domain-containing protein n=1 Tax=Solanum tuberosum TaxID=4113 RepID=A0ABQ7W9M1_SOLTU|nr:hypothetical protein KY290_008126 [Solanum tuberosum]
MTHYQNILTGRYDVDLNETINESDWENITQDEPIDPVNIDDRDFPNYGSPSASDSDDLPNAEELGDNVPFEASSSDDFLMPNRSPRPMSMSPFRNHEIPYLDHLQDGPDIFGDTHDEYTSQRTWGEPEDFMNGAIYIEKGMLFNSKKQLQRAVKLLHLKIAREYFIFKSTKKSWRLVCRRVEQGCRFRLTSFNDKHTNMWKVGRYIKEHTCDMGTCHDGHFNLDVEMIANVLRVDIEKMPSIWNFDKQKKAYLGRKRAFEKVYGTWDGSFAELPRFMEALKHFNPETIVEWKTERRVDVIEDVFNYVFWTFKPCIDGFVFCRPVISIDGTHVYGKYDIELLIAIATDGNGSILPLAFAIVANESMETWSLFLDHLHLHVVKGRRGVTLISDKHHGILSSVYNSPNWQALFGCKSLSGEKVLEKMKMIKEINPEAYVWLMKNDLDKWTLHREGGRRWGMLTTNSSESFNGFLKSARGLPVTAMGFDQIGYQAWEHMAPEFSVRSYKNAYSGQFNPLGGEKYWPDSPFLMIANKKYLRKVGVNKITRIHNEMDVPASTLTRKCSTCKQIGHDRRNCPSRARNASYGGSS